MGKYEKKAPKKLNIIVVILVLVATVAVLTVFVLPGALRSFDTQPHNHETEGTTVVTDPVKETLMTDSTDNTAPQDEPDSKSETGQAAGEAVEYPCQLENGTLEIESLFQFEGINPDCGNREGDKIAAILIRNISDLYLKSASICAVLDDGSEVVFSVSDLPAGKGALAFSVDNAVLADNRECTAFRVDSLFEEGQSMEGISVSVDGTTITATNETDQEITEIEILCHGVFGDTYYGGVTYIYKIEKLSAGESASITAIDCIIGVADVVWVTGSAGK